MRAYRGKYGAKITERAGRSFHSKLEAAVYDMLLLMEKAGEIRDLQCQVEVRLTDAEILYKPDFSCTDRSGATVYIEAKGLPTPEWRIKRRLWMFYGAGPLKVYMGSHRSFKLVETIVPRASGTP